MAVRPWRVAPLASPCHRSAPRHDSGPVHLGGTMKTRKVTVLVATLLCTALLIGACGSGRSGSAGAGDDTSQTTAPADDGAGTFGDLTDVCGPGDPSGATDQGVTPDSVTIGYGDDAGYTGAPGSNHETSLSVEAMIEWCNEAGGHPRPHGEGQLLRRGASSTPTTS